MIDGLTDVCSQLMNHIPARTQGYSWKLVYSTAEHGTSLTTLYRQMRELDRPVLMVIKDTDDQVQPADALTFMHLKQL